MDIEARNLAHAALTYRERPKIQLIHGDAHWLPFQSSSFDVVILFEAIYYLQRPDLFAREARRVLRSDGALLICTANKDLPDFNPSPYSKRYFGPPELVALFEPAGFSVEILGGSPVDLTSLRSRAIRAVKRAAVRLRLIPRSMRSKAVLKRIVFGRLVDLPYELPNDSVAATRPVPIRRDAPALGHQVIHCVARPRPLF
jgi:SAM-dependent methyltransferase